MAVLVAGEVVDGGFEEREAERGCHRISAISKERALQAAVEEVVEAAHFPGDDFLRRAPRRRPERREAPGRFDDEVAIGGRARSDEQSARRL